VHQHGPEGAQWLILRVYFRNRCKRLGYCEKSLPSVNELFSSEDDSLFERITANSAHVLQSYLQARLLTTAWEELSHNNTFIILKLLIYRSETFFPQAHVLVIDYGNENCIVVGCDLF